MTSNSCSPSMANSRLRTPHAYAHISPSAKCAARVATNLPRPRAASPCGSAKAWKKNSKRRFRRVPSPALGCEPALAEAAAKETTHACGGKFRCRRFSNPQPCCAGCSCSAPPPRSGLYPRPSPPPQPPTRSPTIQVLNQITRSRPRRRAQRLARRSLHHGSRGSRS